MTQKTLFVSLFVALLNTLAFGVETPTKPDLSCATFPKTFNVKAVEFTLKEISGNYKVRMELKDVRNFPCVTIPNVVKDHTLYRFSKTKLTAGQSLGTLQYTSMETGRITQTEEIDILGVSFKGSTPTWTWGIDFDLNRYVYSTIGADHSGQAYDKPYGDSEPPTSVPSQISFER